VSKGAKIHLYQGQHGRNKCSTFGKGNQNGKKKKKGGGLHVNPHNAAQNCAKGKLSEAQKGGRKHLKKKKRDTEQKNQHLT